MSFFKFFHIIIFAKYYFSGPKKNKILVYDSDGLRLFKRIFKNVNCGVLFIRGERIYLNLIFKAIIIKIIKNLSFTDSYKLLYFEKVQPNIILTFNDTNFSFFKIHNYYKKAKIVSVQNSYRSNENNDFKKSTDKLYADHIFVFSRAFKKLYEKYINGKVIVLGSPISNSIKIKKLKKKNKKKILFISQFSDRNINANFNFKHKKKNYLENYKKVDCKIANFLNNLFYRTKYEFFILGRYNPKINPKELNFFKENLDKKFNYIPNQSIVKTYQELEGSELVVFVDSTLGYESLCRNCKVVSISFRSEFLKVNEIKFGWPENLKNKKKSFWTNKYSEKDIKKLIEKNLNISRRSWSKKNKATIEKIMTYNSNNNLLRREISKYF